MARPIIPFTSVRHRSERALRKLIAFDDDTLDKLTQLGRDRMATIQDLADEAFADLLKKHNIPIDLKDALRKSARSSKTATRKKAVPKRSASRKTGSKNRKAAA
jgi:non-homologous end joining protein Ku